MAPAHQSNNDRPGFSFLVCADSDLIREEIATQLRRHPPAGAQWERRVFWGDEEPDDSFWNAFGQQGLFESSKALVVRQAHAWNASVWKSLSGILANSHDNVWPFFCLEVAREKGKFKIPAYIQKCRCWTFAEKKAWIWTHQGLSGSSLQAYATKQAKILGIRLEPDALGLFCETVTPSASTVRNELAKLAFVCPDGVIKREMIQADSGNAESDAFACVRKLENGDLPGVWREISRNGSGSLLFFLIALLARELRLFWQLELGNNPWMPPGEATFKRQLAKSIGHGGIARGFSALADAEFRVKSGSASPEQALEFLCVEMADIFQSKLSGMENR